MANRTHSPSLLGKTSPHLMRLRVRMFAKAIRNVGAVGLGLAGGWMVLTLTFEWKLALIATAGLGLVLLSLWLVPFYAEPD